MTKIDKNLELKTRLLDSEKWLRIVHIAIFALLLPLVNIVLATSTLTQAILTLFNDKPNTQLQQFGSSLGTYMQQVINYLLWHGDHKPFPFEHWPTQTTSPVQQKKTTGNNPAKKSIKKSTEQTTTPSTQ